MKEKSFVMWLAYETKSVLQSPVVTSFVSPTALNPNHDTTQISLTTGLSRDQVDNVTSLTLVCAAK